MVRTHKEHEKQWLGRQENDQGECYYRNPGRRKFKVGVAVMPNVAKV